MTSFLILHNDTQLLTAAAVPQIFQSFVTKQTTDIK